MTTPRPEPDLRAALEALRDDIALLAYELTRSPNGPADFRGELNGVIARHRDAIIRAALSATTPAPLDVERLAAAMKRARQAVSWTPSAVDVAAEYNAITAEEMSRE